MTNQGTDEALGVWAVIDRDHNEHVTAVHATEVDALRTLNGRGYGRVMFLPWGKTVYETEAATQ